MQARNITAIAAGLAGMVAATALPNAASAKHVKHSTSSNADPCAEPTAFVTAQVEKIRTLRASLGTHPTNSVYGMFVSGSQTDPAGTAKVAELRRDADAVNNLLRAGGCTPVDIDQQLTSSAPPVAEPSAPLHKRRK